MGDAIVDPDHNIGFGISGRQATATTVTTAAGRCAVAQPLMPSFGGLDGDSDIWLGLPCRRCDIEPLLSRS